MNFQINGWAELPDVLVIGIFRQLRATDAFHAAQSCRRWLDCFESPSLWRKVDFNFYRGEQDGGQLTCVDRFGCHFRTVLIHLNQLLLENRTMAINCIRKLAEIPQRQIQSLKIDFVGENPIFFAGQEFLEVLGYFGTWPLTNIARTLTHLDLSSLLVCLDDETIQCFSNHYATLVSLNIQNRTLVCKVTPNCIQLVAENSPHLQDLRLFQSSLSEAALLAFAHTSKRVAKLRHISVLCLRQVKYQQEEIRDEIWRAVVEANPQLAVTLRFAPDCPYWKVRAIMQPSVPVRNLFLETYNMEYPELEVATDYYGSRIRKIVVQGTASEELDFRILNLARKCHQLESLHVLCTLNKDVVEEIGRLHPQMVADRRNCTLKYIKEPFPWVQSRDLDEIRTDWD